MSQLEYFITAGCSFTAGTSDIDQARSNPESWPHFLLEKIPARFLINLAIPGGGNQQIADNVIYLLETKKYITSENCLIGINFTGLDRLDIMCAVDHPDANKNFSWSKDFGFGWITEGTFVSKTSPFNGMLQKNMELDQTQLSNCLSIVKLLSYLELNRFKYFFMLMNDEIMDTSRTWFNDFVNQGQTGPVIFGQSKSMKSFATDKGLLNKDQFHPNKEAHQLMSNEIFGYLLDKKLVVKYNND